MSSKRMLQVAEQIRSIVSLMLVRGELADPRVKNVSVTSVRMTADLQIARVSFTLSGDPGTLEAASRGLRQASGFLRRAVGAQMQMRYTPELHFHYDKGLDYATHIHGVLSNLNADPAFVASDDDVE